MATFTHKGVTISFEESDAKFVATVGNTSLSAPSLDAIRKKIDAALSQSFTPFTALRLPTHRDYERQRQDGTPVEQFYVVRVVGIEKPHGKITWRNRPSFVFDPPAPSRYDIPNTLYPDTPEMRAAIVAWTKAKEAASEAKERLDEIELQERQKLKPFNALSVYENQGKPPQS